MTAGPEIVDTPRLADSRLVAELAPELVRSPGSQRFSRPLPPALPRRLVEMARQMFLRHWQSLTWLLPLVIAAGVLHGWDMHHSPGPNDDEGTYVSQAWAVQVHGQLSHYTYWYDHPPLGWLLLCGWNLLTFVLPRDASLWYAGRDFMLAIHVASCAALFWLVRRLSGPRWVAAAAVLFFTISPLGMAWQRLTLLDNIATPFLLAAWALALSPRRRLVAHASCGLLLGCAVLIKETNALFVPAVAAQLWITSRGVNRRYTMTVFTGALLGIVGSYPLYAVLKNEFLPGPGHVSLLSALKWQLISRPSSGSPFDPRSGTHIAIADWLGRDGPLLAGALVMAPLVAWKRAQCRPLVAQLLVLYAIPFRGGYLPAPYPINLVWPAALILALGIWVLVRPLTAHRRIAIRVAAAVVAITALGSFSVRAAWADRSYLTADGDREYRQAEAWLLDHTFHDDRMLVDNTLWIDLVQAGYPRQNIVWFYKYDLDPAVESRFPGGWHDVDYVVESSIVGATESQLPRTQAAIEHGQVVATFGDIHVYRLPRARTHR